MSTWVLCAECDAEIEVTHDCAEVLAERRREAMPDSESDADRERAAEEAER